MKLNRSLAAFAVAMSLASGAAFAETQTLQFTVEAQVPTANGLQLSPIGDWHNNTQVMGWDFLSQTLSPIRQQLGMKSGLGEIKSYLITPAVLAGGASNITLTVKVAGQTLAEGPTKAVVVATATEAAAGKLASVEVSAVPLTGGYPAGIYQGTVAMMFESVAP